jgi:putative tryptophan/tyrosine transport system substrate-binding protein
MRRRDFIAGIGSAVAWPMVARAQQRALPMLGYLKLRRVSPANDFTAFRKGLGETGFVEGRNVVTEYALADGHPDRLPALARELVQRGAAVIVAISDADAVSAAKAATATIPIVFRLGNDPVALGLVASLNRPGGNVTGVTSISGELTARRFELIHEMVPDATSIAFLTNPTIPGTAHLVKDAESAAAALGFRPVVLSARNAFEIEAAFATLAQQRPGALVIQNTTSFADRTEQIVVLAARHTVPTIYYSREYVDAGGLMSYGASLAEEFRLTGVYAGRVLKGEKPADLPVMQPTKFEFVLNLKTAKALGLTIPETLLATADEVIQ